MQASQTTITVIDFEGTGAVKGYPDEPWQIGLIQVISGKVQPATISESLLRVGERPFNLYAPGRHAELRPEMANAPTLQTVWPQLRPMLDGIPLTAHNAATENRYLSQAFPLHPPGKWIDTLKLSRIAFPNIKSHKLEDLTDTLGLTDRLIKIIPGRTAHDALYDAAACALLLETIISLPGWENVTVEALQNA
jgi:DNA polymerase III epsilon subunit-like protein